MKCKMVRCCCARQTCTTPNTQASKQTKATSHLVSFLVSICVRTMFAFLTTLPTIATTTTTKLLTSSLCITFASRSNINVYHLAPKLSNGWAVLGDLSKWVPTSPQRLQSVTWNNNNNDGDNSSVTVVVHGAPDETVAFSFLDGAMQAVHAECVLNSAGSISMVVPALQCY